MSIKSNDLDHGIEAIWREHAPRLMAYATYLVGPSDAHDVVVEAVLRAAPELSGGQIEDPRSYLLRAVRNQAFSLRRSRTRRWRRDLAGVGPATSVQPDVHADMRHAIACLSLAQRSVVYLVYWEDRTDTDAADQLGVSASTVRRHRLRALKHLKKALA